MTLISDDERGVSSTVSTVLIIAIVVITASAVGAYVFNVGDESLEEPAPDGSFEFDYQSGNGNLTITYTGGEDIDPERLSVSGPYISGSKFTEDRFGDSISAGDSVTVPFAQLGDEYRIVWETEERSTVLARYTPPAGVDYIFEYNPSADEDGQSIFTSKFTTDIEQNIWYDSADGVRIDERSGLSEGRWVATFDPDENVTVDVDIEAQVSGATGVEMYAITTNGTEITVFCDAGDFGSDFKCSGGNFNGVDGTFTISNDEPIERIVLHYKTDNGWEPIWVRTIRIAK